MLFLADIDLNSEGKKSSHQSEKDLNSYEKQITS